MPISFRLGSQYRSNTTGVFVGAVVPHRGRQLAIRLDDVIRFKGKPPENHLDDIVAARNGDPHALQRLRASNYEAFFHWLSKKESWEQVDMGNHRAMALKTPISYEHLQGIIIEMQKAGVKIADAMLGKLIDFQGFGAGLDLEEVKGIIGFINKSGKFPLKLNLLRNTVFENQVAQNRKDPTHFNNPNPDPDIIHVIRSEWTESGDQLRLLWGQNGWALSKGERLNNCVFRLEMHVAIRQNERGSEQGCYTVNDQFIPLEKLDGYLKDE